VCFASKKSSEWVFFVPPECTSVNLIVYYGCSLSMMDAVLATIFDGGGKRFVENRSSCSIKSMSLLFN